MTTDAAMLKKSLVELGWTLEHVWHDGYGNCSHAIFQAPQGDATMVVATDRDGAATAIFPGRPTNYRRAKEILSQVKEDEQTNDGRRARWAKVGEGISACCTEGWTDYREHLWRDTYGDTWRVTDVAGHGTWARVVDRSAGGPLLPRHMEAAE